MRLTGPSLWYASSSWMAKTSTVTSGQRVAAIPSNLSRSGKELKKREILQRAEMK